MTAYKNDLFTDFEPLFLHFRDKGKITYSSVFLYPD